MALTGRASSLIFVYIFLSFAVQADAELEGDRTLQNKKKDDRPNLVFIMTDQQRFDAISYAKTNKILKTPHINRIAREGVFFRNAYTSAPVCGPARTSLLTGLSIENTKVQENNFPGKANLVSYDMHLAQSEDYNTNYLGKWHAPNYLADGYKNPIDVKSFNIFRPLRTFLFSKGYKFLPNAVFRKGQVEESMNGQAYIPNRIDSRFKSRTISSRGVCECDQYGTSLVDRKHSLTAFESRRAIHALRRLSAKKKPFSLHLSLNSPHGPHTPPEPFVSMYNASSMPTPKSINDPLRDSPYRRIHRSVYTNPKLVGHMTSVYYAQVKEVDLWIGRILQEMDKLGITNNTMVIFTSDHGEMLGSHGMIEKSILYEESARVPLLIRFPAAIKAGQRINTPVSHRDLFATILDYLGASPLPSDGFSLRRLIERNARGLQYAVVENGEKKELMVRVADFKLIIPTRANASQPNAMYNLKRDPNELVNLIGPSRQTRRRMLPLAQNLRQVLVRWLRRTKSPHIKEVRARKL